MRRMQWAQKVDPSHTTTSRINPVSQDTCWNKNMEVHIHPNPSTGGVLNLSIASKGDSPIEMKILDMQGREITGNNLGQLSTGHNDFQLDISGLKAGAYLIHIITEQGKEVRRFSIK